MGKAINPTLLEGQIEGAVHMGLGHALTEEFVVEDGVPVTDDAQVARHHPANGMPAVECILVEEPQPEGPYGAKGVGEIGLVPTAAAVAGALYAFDGIRRTTPDEGLPGGAGRGAAPDPSARVIITSLDPVRLVAGDLWIADGRVAASGEGARIDCDGVLVIPGNVCAHTHLYSALARGMPSALARRGTSSRSSSASGGGSTAPSTRTRCGPPRSPARWRRSSRARRRWSIIMRRRTRSTARST